VKMVSKSFMPKSKLDLEDRGEKMAGVKCSS
jgi:hypothetical protein